VGGFSASIAMMIVAVGVGHYPGRLADLRRGVPVVAR
jgi:hypothetical protein